MSGKIAVAAAICALTLLNFFQFPGHTYLQADSQIYLPILEHIWDPGVLANDLIAERPHVSFTLYDEVQIAGLQQVLLNAVHHHREITFTELRNDDANCERLARSQRPREKIRTIVQLLRSGQYAFARLRGDGLGTGRVIYDE